MGGEFMDFLLIGSMNSYIKNLGMKHKWSQRKKNNDFTPDESLTEKQRLNEQFKASYMAQQENDKTDEAMASIRNKINSGAKLTPEEMNYLRAKDPTTYQKLKNIENEKKSYERELKQCKTKEEVQKLKVSKVNASLTAINAVKDNPNIPESKKLEVAIQEQRRLNELDKVLTKFVKSSEYKNMPTETELKKVQNDIKKAEEAEQQKDDKTTDITENTKPENNNVGYEEQKNSENTKNIESDTVSDRVPDKIQAENSPESMKVKRTKAKIAYKKVDFSESEEKAVVFNTKG